MLNPEKFKTLPHAAQAEQAVLGGLMLDNQAWDNIADILTNEDFYQPANQIICPGQLVIQQAEAKSNQCNPHLLHHKFYAFEIGDWRLTFPIFNL